MREKKCEDIQNFFVKFLYIVFSSFWFDIQTQSFGFISQRFLTLISFFFKWYKYYDEDTLAILCFIGRVLYCLLRASVVFDDEFSRQ